MGKQKLKKQTHYGVRFCSPLKQHEPSVQAQGGLWFPSPRIKARICMVPFVKNPWREVIEELGRNCGMQRHHSCGSCILGRYQPSSRHLNPGKASLLPHTLKNRLPDLWLVWTTSAQITGVLDKNSGSQGSFQVFQIKISKGEPGNLRLWEVARMVFMYSEVWEHCVKIKFVR